MNRVELTASIVEISPLRYTPAGCPVINLVLVHESTTLEDGASRKINLTIKAVAFDVLAQKVSQLVLGQTFEFSGLLISARNHKSIVFHLKNLSPL